MNYNDFRHFADSWGLLMMGILFLVLIIWPFRKGASQRNEDAANIIFRDDDHV
ncbi:MAG: cbb3-type cytochrome oxidase subunit 3 [Sphingorhabdus sp.]